MIRGIERKEIVINDHDRQDFVSRMGTIALKTGTLIYAMEHLFQIGITSIGVSKWARLFELAAEASLKRDV